MEEEAPSPLLMGNPPRSSGRVLLTHVLWQYCGIQWGMSYEELAAALAPDTSSEGLREDRGNVETAVRLLGEALADGAIEAFARPLGGGEPSPLKRTVWEIEDFLPRFRTSRFDAKRPFDTSASPTHWIFLDASGSAAFIDACFEDPEPVHARPARRPMVDAVSDVPITRAADRLIRLDEVEVRTGLKKSSIYERMLKGRFPLQASRRGETALWRESDIEEYVRDPK